MVTEGLAELLTSLLANPAVLATFVIQFGLGFGLGYFSARVLKHILALIGILVLGTFLNAWQFSVGLEDFMTEAGYRWEEIYRVIMDVLSAFGILTIIPTTAGFFLGVLVAIR